MREKPIKEIENDLLKSRLYPDSNGICAETSSYPTITLKAFNKLLWLASFRDVENIFFLCGYKSAIPAQELASTVHIYIVKASWQIDVRSRLVRLVPMNISATPGFSCQSTRQDTREREKGWMIGRGGESLLCIETHGPANFRPKMTRGGMQTPPRVFHLPRWSLPLASNHLMIDLIQNIRRFSMNNRKLHIYLRTSQID